MSISNGHNETMKAIRLGGEAHPYHPAGASNGEVRGALGGLPGILAMTSNHSSAFSCRVALIFACHSLSLPRSLAALFAPISQSEAARESWFI